MKSFRLSDKDAKFLAKHYGTPVEVVSTDMVEYNYQLLQTNIPRARIFYAIKSNSATCILKKLIALGSSFDVASAGEIRLLQSLGVTGDRMIYANPVKTPEGLQAAKEAGITKLTFDSEAEIGKIAQYLPGATVLARLKIEHSDATIDLSSKFGAKDTNVVHLLTEAQGKGLKAEGICFHVGSQSLTTNTYRETCIIVKRLIEEAKYQGLNIRYVDIGGGLPAPTLNVHVDVETMMKEISHYLDELLPDVEIWAEPGRYMCCTAVNILSSVIGHQERNNERWYFLDDGVYGTFSGVIFDHWDYDLQPIRYKELAGNTEIAMLAGPSCDSLDIIKRLECPPMDIGDLFLAQNVGAYSKVSATTFNGFAIPKTIEWEAAKEELKL